MESVDVLIVGGGPTGLMLALELSVQDISFRILDKAPQRSQQSRALVVQPRSLELLNRHGVAHELVSQGWENPGVQLFVHRRPATTVDTVNMGPEDTQFRSPFFISQAETESHMEQALSKKYGKVVEWSITIDDLKEENPQDNDPDKYGVTATLHDAQGKQSQVRAKYVVGCDGAHSIVRHSAGLRFEGAAYPQDFILADTRLKKSSQAPDSGSDTARPVKNLSLCLGSDGVGFMAIFPLRGDNYRLICSRPGHAFKDSGAAESNHNNNNDDADQPSLKDFQNALDHLGPVPVTAHDPTWITNFRLHHRQVNQYRAGRFFVAGDAAHIHSPAGGQGMNTGIQDAANLAWKLGLVLHHRRPEALLDTYHSERWKVGHKVLQTTDRAFEAIATRSPMWAKVRNFVAGWIAPWIVWVLGKDGLSVRLRFITQLSIRYRESEIVGTGKGYRGRLRGGDRAPDGELRKGEESLFLQDLFKGKTHHLVLFLGENGLSKEEQECVQSITEGNEDIVSAIRLGSAKYQHQPSGGQQEIYLDTDNVLHSRYGFTDGPGYVLIRPDEYIAHIGPASALAEFRSWFLESHIRR